MGKKVVNGGSGGYDIIVIFGNGLSGIMIARFLTIKLALI